MKHFKSLAFILGILFITCQISYGDSTLEPKNEKILIKNNSDATIQIINVKNTYTYPLLSAIENQIAILPQTVTAIDTTFLSDGGFDDNKPLFQGTFLVKCPGSQGYTNFINYAITGHMPNKFLPGFLTFDLSHVYATPGSPICVHVPQEATQKGPNQNGVNEIQFTN